LTTLAENSDGKLEEWQAKFIKRSCVDAASDKWKERAKIKQEAAACAPKADVKKEEAIEKPESSLLEHDLSEDS
jgi:hypothetical protein